MQLKPNDLSKIFILLGQTALLKIRVLLIPQSFKTNVKHKTDKKGRKIEIQNRAANVTTVRVALQETNITTEL